MVSDATFTSLLLAHAKLLTTRRPGLAPGATLPRLERGARGVAADPSWLARYRRVCGLADDGALPSLAPQLMAAPLHLALLADPAFPIPAMGIVHVANRTEERARLPSGAALDLVARVAGSREAALGVEIDLVTEATLDGAIVWRTTTTALARRRGEKGGARAKREGGALDITVSPPKGGTAHVEIRVAPSPV